MKAKINPTNIIAYLQGHWRNWFYDNRYLDLSWLIRTHIKEQIDYRIKIMDPLCYNTGSCRICGCETPALQMANKACDKPCYPKMMGRKDWEDFKKKNNLTPKGTHYELLAKQNCQLWQCETEHD